MLVVPAVVVVENQRNHYSRSHDECAHHQPCSSSVEMGASCVPTRKVEVVYVQAQRAIDEKTRRQEEIPSPLSNRKVIRHVGAILLNLPFGTCREMVQSRSAWLWKVVFVPVHFKPEWSFPKYGFWPMCVMVAGAVVGPEAATQKR